MNDCLRILVLLVTTLAVSSYVLAEEAPTEASIRAAIDKGLPLLVAGAKGSMEQRKQCFTCHNQGMAIMALTAVRQRGIEIDEVHFQTQVAFTAAFLAKNAENYREGKGQGGQADTAGYALWALDNGDWKADDTTAAVAEYLLRYQSDRDHWDATSSRPPTEHSSFTTSYVALRGLKAFGLPEQRERIDKRFEQLRQWLTQASPQETEDRVFRLRALATVGATETELAAATDELLKTQREDGGWAQLDDMQSDAYATGSALVALHEAGELATDSPAYQRGVAYLLANQLEDGSWRVVSRSKPFQTYFESGYPHGKDQFISSAAAGWAITALALALPEPIEPPAPE
jgi:hypothetical protein